MRTIIRAVLLICILPLTITAESKPIKIGATLALSGTLSFLGQHELHGLVLAVEHINQAGGVDGRNFELVIEDNRGDPKQAVLSVKKLLEIDQVDFLFSAFSHITNAVKGLVAQKGITMIYAASHTDIAAYHDKFFQDFPSTEGHAQQVAAYVKSRYKRVYFFTEINEACLAYEQYLLNAIAGSSLKVIKRAEFIHGEADFKTQILSIKAANPDAVIMCAWRDTDVFMKQYAQLDMLATPTVHTYAPFLPVAESAQVLDLLQQNKAVSTWYGFVPKSNEPALAPFFSSYQQRFKVLPRPDAAMSYDDIHMFALALKDCTSPTSVNQKCVANNLSKLNYPGILGPVSFNKERIVNRDILILMQVRDGKWQRIE